MSFPSDQKFDAIVIGAGPVGVYVGWQLAKENVSVAVFDALKATEIKKSLGYLHFDGRSYDQLNIPRPVNIKDVNYGIFEDMWQIPITESKKFAVPYNTDIVSANGFVQWIAKCAQKESKVQIFYECPYEGPIVENGKLKGVKIRNHGKVYATVVVDCSGNQAVVRNSLPSECHVSPLKTRPHRMFTVYMQKWRCLGEFPKGSNTYVCYKGFANQVGPNETLIGLSTLNGLAATKEVHAKFVAHHLSNVQHELVEEFYGEVPFDFPPLSLVGENFVSIGDSAFQNKPFNGEGMAAGMEAGLIAIPFILQAIKEPERSFEYLWHYNTAYFQGIGADLGLIRGTGETIVDLVPEDFDWMYRAEFLSKEDMISTWTKYTVKKGLGSIIKSGIRGLGNFSVFRKILKGLILGQKIHSLLLVYPVDPKKFPEWEAKFKKLIPQTD